jgi:hypothetical protein
MGKKSNSRRKAPPAAKHRGGFNPIKKGTVVQAHVRGSRVIQTNQPDPRMLQARRRLANQAPPPQHMNPGGYGIGSQYGLPVGAPPGTSVNSVLATGADIAASAYYGGAAGVVQNVARRGIHKLRRALVPYA